MNDLHSFASIAAGIIAVMMTVVSWWVLREHSSLDSRVLPVCVGLLTFIGLRYRPGGLLGAILLSYEAVAISILFLLLWMAFQKVCKTKEKRKKEAKIARQSSQLREGPQDLQKTRTKTSRRDIQRPND